MVLNLFPALVNWGEKRVSERKNEGGLRQGIFVRPQSPRTLNRLNCFPKQRAPCTLLTTPHACISFVTFGLNVIARVLYWSSVTSDQSPHLSCPRIFCLPFYISFIVIIIEITITCVLRAKNWPWKAREGRFLKTTGWSTIGLQFWEVGKSTLSKFAIPTISPNNDRP